MRRAVIPRASNQASALDERDDRVGLFVGEQLAVGQARVVVDDRVEVVVAERVVALALVAAIAGDRVTGPPEARIALDVHVQQIAGARPLVADELLARRSRCPRAAMATQDRVNGRGFCPMFCVRSG